MSREVTTNDSYVDKVKKLIPAEVSAAFLAINASIPLEGSKLIFAVGFFIILIPICIAYLRLFEKVGSWLQIAFISGVAFPIWAMNIAIDRIEWLQGNLFVASGLLVLVTLIVPLMAGRQP